MMSGHQVENISGKQPLTTAAQTASTDKNYLFDDLIGEISRHPLRWRLVITIGQPGDPTNDATLPWPAERQQVDAGTLTLDQVSSEETGRCTDVNYDPLVLPPRYRAIRRPTAQCSVGRLFAFLHVARCREG
jgi:catalase